jgi:hypothetical protein
VKRITTIIWLDNKDKVREHIITIAEEMQPETLFDKSSFQSVQMEETDKAYLIANTLKDLAEKIYQKFIKTNRKN